MESTIDNSTSSVLFDDSLESTLLQGNNATPPSNETSAFLHNMTDWLCGTSRGYSRLDPEDFLFFIFPIMGIVILVAGSCVLRRRQLRRDAEAVRRRDARIDAAVLAEKLREERRTRVVERALVTTKVKFMPKRTTASSSFGNRGRTFSMETDATVDELDSTNSSSCYLPASVRRASEEPSDDHADDEENLSEAERGQRIATSDIASMGLSPTASETLSVAVALENPTAPHDWRKETCAICLEPYREDDDVSYSIHRNCPHAFHAACILSWLKDEMRNDCPYCRGPYLHLCVTEEDGVSLGGDGGDSTTADVTEGIVPTRGDATTNNNAVGGGGGSNV